MKLMTFIDQYIRHHQALGKSFVKDANATWGSMYFLLGGDTGHLPYQNKSINGDVVNVYYRRSTDQGTTWGPEILLNDDGTGTDQWFPAVASGPDGTVHIAWYDRRERHGCGNSSQRQFFHSFKSFGHRGRLGFDLSGHVIIVEGNAEEDTHPRPFMKLL